MLHFLYSLKASPKQLLILQVSVEYRRLQFLCCWQDSVQIRNECSYLTKEGILKEMLGEYSTPLRTWNSKSAQGQISSKSFMLSVSLDKLFKK